MLVTVALHTHCKRLIMRIIIIIIIIIITIIIMMMIIKIKKDVMVRSVICNLACVASGLRFWGRREKK